MEEDDDPGGDVFWDSPLEQEVSGTVRHEIS